ncbi:gliding motility lipoprotein GldB [Bacteroidia bacterium]|nr:gliding motility lipoprotein GldB [Bacteroidia bacterium]
MAILLAILLAGCQKTNENYVPVEIIRFDKILFSLDPVHPDLSLIDSADIPFFSVYTGGVLNLNDIDSPDFQNDIATFLSEPTINEIQDTVALRYPTMQKQEDLLTLAFGRFNTFFPDKTVPKVYTHISGFNQSIVVDEPFVGIGLDNYLGENCTFYKLLAVPIPQYMQKKMTADHIVRDVIYAWLSTEFGYMPRNNDLLSGLIYQGKITYLMEQTIQEEPLERIFTYTKEQLNWCKSNEAIIWEFLISHEYLYTTKPFILLKYLNDAPFSSGMPTDSPGRAVVWNGYQIVKRYMDTTKTGISELMAEQDYHKILRVSKYRPR